MTHFTYYSHYNQQECRCQTAILPQNLRFPLYNLAKTFSVRIFHKDAAIDIPIRSLYGISVACTA